MDRLVGAAYLPLSKTGVDALDTILLLQEIKERARAEESLRETFTLVQRAKQEWEATADSVPELICLIDDRGRILRTNRTVESWHLGRVVASKGIDFHKLIHSDCSDAGCYLDGFLDRARVEASAGIPTELEAYDTILGRHLLVRVQPVLEPKRVGPGTTVVVIQDVSERKRAEEALRRHAERLKAMNAIEAAIVAARSPEEVAQAALSRIRQLVPFHHARVTLYDPPTDEFLVLAADANGCTHLRPGRSLPGFAFRGCDGRSPEEYHLIADLVALDDRTPAEQQLVEAGMRSFLSIPLVAEEEFIGSFSLASAQFGAFDAEHVRIVREVADLLSIAICQAQLYRRLEQANRELQRALRTKDEILQNVSHELRTPLFLIQGYIELFKEGPLGPLTQDQAQALDILEAQGERLFFMVKQLLDMKALDGRALQKVWVTLEPMLKKILEAWKTVAARKGMRVSLEITPGLPGLLLDTDLFKQVLQNLLDNAVKFSPNGGAIAVRAWQDEGEVRLAVTDQGIGIQADQLTRVFERFYQVNGGLSRPYGGMGIGLALCQAIVQAHGGRIWAESRGEGEGSTFHVALPVCQRDDAEGRIL